MFLIIEVWSKYYSTTNEFTVKSTFFFIFSSKFFILWIYILLNQNIVNIFTIFFFFCKCKHRKVQLPFEIKSMWLGLGTSKTLSILRKQQLDWRKLMWPSETVALVERICGPCRNFQRCIDEKYLKMWKSFQTHVKWGIECCIRIWDHPRRSYLRVCTQTLQRFLSYPYIGRWESYGVTYSA